MPPGTWLCDSQTIRGKRSYGGNFLRDSNGGADGIRTHDLLDAIEARSQLRHGPTDQSCKFITSVGTSTPSGRALATHLVTSRVWAFNTRSPSIGVTFPVAEPVQKCV